MDDIDGGAFVGYSLEGVGWKGCCGAVLRYSAGLPGCISGARGLEMMKMEGFWLLDR